MNKRIQKKVAKREALHAESDQQSAASSAAQTRASGGRTPPGRRAAAVRAVAKQVREAGDGNALGSVIAIAEQVQERTSEAIGQVKDKLAETEQKAEALYKEKEAQLKEKLAETEERAEALLEKVPLVGAAAARKLHELTHR